jgi:hypothetical protein
MPIQNYPRFLTKASKTAQQIQSGLPIVGSDGVSGDFNALKVNSDGSINVSGGGGTATSTNQVTQINLATDTNTKIDLSNVRLDLINSNTQPSANLGLIISNLLESADGNGVYRSIAEMLVPNYKNNTLDSSYSKSFNATSGTHTFSLSSNGYLPWKIVFNENGTEITDLQNSLGTTVISNYFTHITTNPIANAGQQLIAYLLSQDDFFKQITTVGNCHFTAFYSYSPYV